MALEKKSVWIVNGNLTFEKANVIVEDGKILFFEHNDGSYGEWISKALCGARCFDSEEEAQEYQEKRIEYLRDNMKNVKDYIIAMDRIKQGQFFDFKKEDYLGEYARESYDYQDDYDKEMEYANKLEVFIHSKMLDIGGFLIPFSEIKCVKWYGVDNDTERYDNGHWKAEITTSSGETIETSCESDVRLVKTVLGECNGTYFIDETIDYEQ